MTFLTETKKIILKGIAIATAVSCVTFVGFKLFKKTPSENVPNDTITNQCKNSEGEGNENISKEGICLSIETPIAQIEGKDIDNDGTDVPGIGKMSLEENINMHAPSLNNFQLSDKDKSDFNGFNINAVPTIKEGIIEKSESSTTEFDSSQELSSVNSSYTKSSQDDETSQYSERIEKDSIRKVCWVNIFPEESDLKYNPKLMKNTFIKKGGVTYVKTQDDKEIKAGTFHEYSVGGLKEALKDKTKTGGGKISAIGVAGAADSKCVDVSCLQADPKYANNTVFVLASNFNALETLRPADNIDEKLLCLYATDMTQGPIASISAPATAFYRQYAIFRNEDNEDKPLEWKQRNDGFIGLEPKQLNLLEDLGINTQNGYVVDKSRYVRYKMLGRFKDKAQGHKFQLPPGITLDQLPNNQQEAYDKFKIAYFSDCQVVYKNKTIDKLDKFYDENQCIDQVCVAALALDYDGSDMSRHNDQDCECAKLTIKAQYEAILRAAALHGKKNVVIPIVGGGVFKNDPQWTVDALRELKDIIQDYGLNVIVNTYRSDRMESKAKRNLIKLIKETGGTFNEYKKDRKPPVNLAKTHHSRHSSSTDKELSQSSDRK